MQYVRAAFLLFSCAVIAGCFSSAGLTVEKKGEVCKATVNSTILDRHVQVLERTTRRVNGLMEVQIRGQNITDKDIQLEYRFIWLDAEGVPLESGMSVWKPLHLSAREDAFLKAIAPSPEAEDFLMTLRFVNKATRW